MDRPGDLLLVPIPAGMPLDAQVSNTFDAHRVLTAAYKHGGAKAQDKAAEALFHSYFAKERLGELGQAAVHKPSSMVNQREYKGNTTVNNQP